MPKRLKKRRWLRAVGILSLLLGLFLFGAFYNGLVTRRYLVTSAKLAGSAPIRVALLTDLHGCVYGENQWRLYRRVAREEPDLILLGGDIADDVNPLAGVWTLLERIVKIAPCYYVPGSHDMWRSDYSEVCRQFESMGVILLEGRTERVEIRGMRITLSGANDPTVPFQDDAARYGAYLREAFSGLDPEEYNILLAHRPDYIEQYAALPFDLVLSGHTHGGQVRVPWLLNGLYAPGQGWFPAYAGGQYRLEGMELIVSRGLSYYPKLPRVFNPPEVVILELSPRGESAKQLEESPPF